MARACERRLFRQPATELLHKADEAPTRIKGDERILDVVS